MYVVHISGLTIKKCSFVPMRGLEIRFAIECYIHISGSLSCFACLFELTAQVGGKVGSRPQSGCSKL